MPIPSGLDETTAYTTLVRLKLALGGVTDTARDDLLNDAIETASRQIDGVCGRHFYLSTASARTYSTSGRVVRVDDGDRLLIDDVGSLTGLVIETGSASTSWTAVTDGEYLPDNALASGEPITSLLLPSGTTSRMRVTAQWGWPTVPAAVGRAALIQSARLFKRQDSPEGVLGDSQWGAVRVSRIDPDVAALLEPFRLYRVA